MLRRMTDHRLSSPAALRNRDLILDVLRTVLPTRGTVLEIASGSGEHVMHFARHLPNLVFQPSDPGTAEQHSIAAWAADSGLRNINPPIALDAAAPPWPIDHADAVICINMIHISPWQATEGLMRGAAAILPSGAPLYLYGPYRRSDMPLEPSNAAFDANLRSRNPAWGLRALDDVAALAAARGFSSPTVTPMPANNLSLVFRKF